MLEPTRCSEAKKRQCHFKDFIFAEAYTWRLTLIVEMVVFFFQFVWCLTVLEVTLIVQEGGVRFPDGVGGWNPPGEDGR